MQKKIIALAIAAAFSAPAFADTTVYGVVDAVLANISASGTKSDLLVHSGGLAGSRLGVKTSEDLGNGMKVSAVLEYSLDVATASSIGNARQEMLALSGGFGTVAAGYLQTTGYDFSRFDPTAGSLVSPLGNITSASFLIGNAAGLKRAPRALAYISPDMGGFTVAVNYTTEASGGTGNLGVADASSAEKPTAYLLSANYAAGPLAAAVVHANLTNAITAAGAGGAKVTETAIGVSYDLEVAKLFATYQTNKDDSNATGDSDNVMSFSAVAPVGPGAVAFTYAKASMTAQGTDNDASGMTVAWLQGLSKTATLYAAYSTMAQGSATKTYSVAGNAIGGAAALAGGTGSNMVAVGLNKKF